MESSYTVTVTQEHLDKAIDAVRNDPDVWSENVCILMQAFMPVFGYELSFVGDYGVYLRRRAGPVYVFADEDVASTARSVMGLFDNGSYESIKEVLPFDLTVVRAVQE